MQSSNSSLTFTLWTLTLYREKKMINKKVNHQNPLLVLLLKKESEYLLNSLSLSFSCRHHLTAVKFSSLSIQLTTIHRLVRPIGAISLRITSPWQRDAFLLVRACELIGRAVHQTGDTVPVKFKAVRTSTREGLPSRGNQAHVWTATVVVSAGVVESW